MADLKALKALESELLKQYRSAKAKTYYTFKVRGRVGQCLATERMFEQAIDKVRADIAKQK